MATDQTKLNPELSQWLEARTSSLQIAKTTHTPSGQTLDWIPIESQIAAGKIASAPPVTAMPVRSQEAQRAVKPVTFELDDPSVERGPAGTVPVLRPDLSLLTRTVALKDYLRKTGGLFANKSRPNTAPTDPNPAGYFHCTDSQSTKLYGCDLFLNVWDPKIGIPSAPGDDHSILQIWLQNYDKPKLQSIEGGWTVDKGLNGDLNPHIFTYYTTNGYSSDGDNLGGYNRLHRGWVQYSPSVFPGIGINGISVYGGEQFDVSMKFQLYREPANGDLNWWVSVQGIWMGYYPATLFNGGLGNDAEWIGAGGEVYSSLANPSNTTDQMGSGWQAEGGWTHAAFVRNLRNQSNLAGAMVNNNGTAESDTASGGGTNPYDIVLHMDSGSSWGSYFYVGGPSKARVIRHVADEVDLTKTKAQV
jgi:hypothetical protein